MNKAMTAEILASEVQGRLMGDPTVVVSSVASLLAATEKQVSFLGNDKYILQVPESRAGIIFLPETYAEQPREKQAYILCKNPSAAFQKMVDIFAPPAVEYPAGRHPTAVVEEGAIVPASCHIGAYVVISKHAVIGENTILCPHTYIGEHATIGEDCLIYPNVTIRERCLVGNRCIIHSGTVIGSDGFGFIPNPNGHIKIPQVGIVELKDDVELGANVTIDRARFGCTTVGKGTKIDNLVQVAHNVEIGEHCFLCAQVGIAGSTTIGNRCTLAGQVGLAGHIHISDDSTVLAQSGVMNDLEPKSKVLGSPALPHKEYVRAQLQIHSIGKLKMTVKTLEKELADLKARLAEIEK